MAGVFEVEVDGVEHDHGHGHRDDASQGCHPSREIRNRPVFTGKMTRPVSNQYGTRFVPYFT
ncbi:hypothetical protein DPX16_21510 [Anabarilius grahami]|uniref:Uncharacterized protein n=1 Tax=Anabarilius grahami TaxID=495550 RepID=A0A3N0XUL7_ANAGA|nr:hypothetical protein DPX16_21510 [Anabarilius grahami]